MSWLSTTMEMSFFNVKSGFTGACELRCCSEADSVRSILAPGPRSAFSPSLTSYRHVFAEAIVRGHKLGLLTTADYNNLSQCDTLEDIKLYLTGTDYGDYVQNLASPMQTTAAVEACTQKLVDDWAYLRENAGEPLGRFMDYCTYGHMIDNVVLIVMGTLHERDVNELLDKCHPLGLFDSLASLGVAQNVRDLYRLVLVDTPLAPYFSDSNLSSEDLDEINVEILRNSLYKAYLDDFAAFCTSLGGTTAEVMTRTLAFEADRRALNITLNSIGTELTREDRRRLYSNHGLLYPHGQAELAAADDFDGVRVAMERVPEYAGIFSRVGAGEAHALDKMLYDEEVRRAVDSFEQQFHFGVFHSYLSLR